jgi:hypothetical protein
MFARGMVSLHTTHLPVQKTLAPKPRVSITSKLIETKALQVLYFDHLRKTGGRGSGPTNSTRASSAGFSLCSFSFQALAHSFIFRITPIRCIFRNMCTLSQKTGGWGLPGPTNPANQISTATTVFSCPGTGNGRRFRHQSRVTNHQSALSIAEGFARALLTFHPPRLHVLSRFPSKSFVSPTCKISARNSFVSPTYAKTGGVGPFWKQNLKVLLEMSACRHF